MPRGAVDSSMHYCPRPQGRGQLCIELSTVPRGIVLTILPQFYYTTDPETNIVLLAIDCFNLARHRKLMTSLGILVTLNIISHEIVKNFTTLYPPLRLHGQRHRHGIGLVKIRCSQNFLACYKVIALIRKEPRLLYQPP